MSNSFTSADSALNLERYGTPDMEAFVRDVEDSITFKTGGAWLCVASLMSDAQEEIDGGRTGAAKQTLNRAKFLLSRYFAH